MSVALQSMGSSVHPAALRAARERAGITQHELARLVGVAGGERISRWELGMSEPRVEFLPRLAEILKVRPRKLLWLSEEGPDLHALRYEAGMSVAHVAERANISAPTYVRWEAGRWSHLPPDTAIRELGQVLGVPREAVVAALQVSKDARTRTRAGVTEEPAPPPA